MGFDKAEVKKATLTGVGAHVEDQLEQVEAQAHEATGAGKALKAHCKNLLGIVAATDKAVDDTKSEDHIPDLQTLKLVKAWLMKAVRATESASHHQRNVALQLVGAGAQLKQTHNWLQKEVTRTDAVAERKAREAQEAEAASKTNPDVVKDEDGDLVYLGDGAAPAGVRMGNRAEKKAHAEAKEQLELGKSNGTNGKPKRTPVVKKKATKKKVAKKAAPKRADSGGNGANPG